MKMIIPILALIPALVSGTPYGYYYQPSQYYVPHYRSYSHQPFTLLNSQIYNYQPVVRVATTDSSIVDQTVAQTESLVATIRELNNNPIASGYIQKVLDSSSCINNLEDAIAAIEQGSTMVQNAGEDIVKLVAKARGLENKKDIPAVVRNAAEILRILEVLIPKIAPANPEVCGAGSEETFNALHGIANLLVEVSGDNQITMTYQTRGELKRSARVIIGVTAFLKQLGDSFSKSKEFCTSDKQYNVESVKAIGATLDNLADLFGFLGGSEDSEKIREQAQFTRRIAAGINNLKDLDLGTLNCETPGDFKVAAATLDDLATIIADVGIDELSAQLGIVLIF